MLKSGKIYTVEHCKRGRAEILCYYFSLLIETNISTKYPTLVENIHDYMVGLRVLSLEKCKIS